MIKTQDAITILFIVIAVAIGTIVGDIFTKKEQNLGYTPRVEVVRTATQATSSIGIYASASLLSADPDRRVTQFSNIGANPVYICFSSTCTVETGILLAGSSTAQLINSEFPYIGAVSAYGTIATTTLQVTHN